MAEVGKRLWRVAPWVITAGAVAYLVYLYPVDRIAREMARGDWVPVLPCAVAAALIGLVLVGTADALVFRACIGGPGWWSVVKGKAGAHVLLVLGYGFGQGGYGVWLARATGAGAKRTVGLIGYVTFSDLAALCLVTAVASAASGGLAGGALPVGVAAAAAAGLLAFSAAALAGPAIVGRFVDDPDLLHPWAAVGAGTFAASVVLRALNVWIWMVLVWLAANAFGIELPFGAAMIYLPMISFVASIPVNVLGFGPVQYVWVDLFSPWATGERILAFQFLFQMFFTFALVGRGVPFVWQVTRDIAAARDRE